ncbi:hypothetical protein KM1_260830, partial [Entamoeba histolytica HM-3:IMSS]
KRKKKENAYKKT